MKSSILASALLALLLLTGCDDRHKFEYQPNIQWGGRIVALAKHPSKDNVVMAAAETGGLFISEKSGRAWHHIELPVFEMVDVAYAPNNPAVVLATAFRDLKKNNGGGIWRSTDGGKTWSKPPSSVRQTNGNPVATHGYDIAFEPGSDRVFVGTEQGLAVSADAGNTWSFQDISLSFGPDGPVAPEVWSVAAAPGGKVVAATSLGMYYSENGGGNWFASAPGFAIGALANPGGLCISPLNSKDVFFAAANYLLYYSADGGKNWMTINAPAGGGRPSFIRLGLVEGARALAAYYGNGASLFRKQIPVSRTRGTLDFSRPWDTLTLAHADPSDLIFNGSQTAPLLVSGDGGIMNTEDGGLTWKMTGGGNKCLNALQITEVTGQETFFEDKRKTYLYFGTQDNELWASDDGGRSWKNNFPWEGFSIQAKRRGLVEKGNLLTFIACAGCGFYAANPGFTGVRGWNPPAQPAGDAAVWPTDPLDPEPPERFVQMSTGTPDFLKRTRKYMNQTYDGGGSWRRIGSTFLDPAAQIPQISNPYGATVIYQAVSLPQTTPQGWGRIGLIKFSNIGSVSGTRVEEANGNGFGSLGIFPTMFKWYVVFAVNPADPNHLIAADVQDSKMKVTWDGGRNWFPDDELTALVTANGAFNFYAIVGCCPKILVTCIRFNPDNPSEIAVGTRENGIFYSSDKGETWCKVYDTNRITNASSIFFGFDQSIVVSSYGRGLWKWNPKEQRCTSLGRGSRFSPKGAYRIDLEGGSLTRLGDLDSLLEDGRVKAILPGQNDLVSLKELQEKAGSDWEISGFTRYDGKRSETSREQRIRIGIPTALSRVKVETAFISLPVRAALVNPGGQLVSLVLSREPYQVKTPEERLEGPLTQPYLAFSVPQGVFMEGQAIGLSGFNFEPSGQKKGGGVTIYLDGKAILTDIPVGKEGAFFAEIPGDPARKNGALIAVEQKGKSVARWISFTRAGDRRE